MKSALTALLLIVTLIPVPTSSYAQCVANQGTIVVTLSSADSGNFEYTWQIQNNDGGVGNRLENVYFEIATATPSSPTTSLSTWTTATENMTTFNGSSANWTAFRFDYDSGTQIFNGATETFTYTLDQFVSSIRLRTKQKNGQILDFAEFTSAGSCSLLPVELVSFDARTDGPVVSLYWATATEENTAGFEIQYRRFETFETIGFVEATGTSDELRRYQFDHSIDGPAVGTYRLKMIDLDGTFEYSQQIEVVANLPDGFFISPNYPNPFNPTTQFEIAVERDQKVTVEVFDVTGRSVMALLDARLERNTPYRVAFDAGSLPSGLYIVRSLGETFSSSRVMTLLK